MNLTLSDRRPALRGAVFHRGLASCLVAAFVFAAPLARAQDDPVVARVNGDPDVARQTLLDRLTRIDPNMEIVTLRSFARLETLLLRIAFWVSLVLGGLALLLTVSRGTLVS